MDDSRNGVLIILIGGNVCLVADEDKRRQAGINHRPASIEEFKEIILGDRKAEYLLSREKYIDGINLRVDFFDLRRDVNRSSIDPEELDSSQLDPGLWASIAQVIYDKYLDYEGFVILHGLDTMAYTASGLSFMLQRLNSPVVLTGSQRPLNYSRTDAIQNIITAITIAGAASLGFGFPIPEVMICCFDSLLRGNRSTMIHASSYRAFDSPNYSPLATFGEHIDIQNVSKRSLKKTRRLILRKNFNSMVTILDVFPGMDPCVIEQLASTRGLKGVLLRTYGLGTAPTSKEVIDALKKVVDANIVVMNVTQARGGRISYREDPVSLRLLEHGVISGADMTAEAAYAKMVVLLSESEISRENNVTEREQREIAEDLLQIDQCGEQSQSIFHFHFGSGETLPDKNGNFSAILETSRPMEERHLVEANLDKIAYIQLSVLGLYPSKESDVRFNRLIEFEVFIVNKYPDRYEMIKRIRQDVLRWYTSSKKTINVACDISDSLEYLLSPDTRLGINTTEPIKWEKMTIAIYLKLPIIVK
ncbi:MAG: asparaginase [Candidatus Aminicenantes bacterium]|nr:asparaginase [Candidatus Aminicenantes bacterium]